MHQQLPCYFSTINFAMEHFYLAVLSVLLVDFVGAQSPPINGSDQQQFNTFNPMIVIILIVLLVLLFAMGYGAIYLRQCTENPASIQHGGPLATWRRRRGLDHVVIEALPTFPYSEIKEHMTGKGALECAICLNEFNDNDMIRLLPNCDHVFHPDCVNVWLEHHITCPVCRSDLTKAKVKVPPPPVVEENHTVDVGSSTTQKEDEIQISIKCETSRQSFSTGKLEGFDMAKQRSHTTGHSLVLPGENLDRFTLRIPIGVRKNVMEQSMLNRTKSYASGTSNNGESGFERSTKSYRHAILTRTMSILSPKAATEGRDGGIYSGISRMGSLKCLEPKATDEQDEV